MKQRIARTGFAVLLLVCGAGSAACSKTPPRERVWRTVDGRLQVTASELARPHSPSPGVKTAGEVAVKDRYAPPR